MLIARLYALSTGGSAPAELPPFESVPTYVALGFSSMEAGDISEVLREAQQEIMELRRLLFG